ncbi:MAG: hypothetical protein EXQ95_04705 [Alphaproteobacteria bacterium]|nr:hypothetical protein [Alphaproteobacteria bacterium]
MSREVHKKRFPGLPGPADVTYEPRVVDVDDIRLRALFRRWRDDLANSKPRAGEEILAYPEVAPLIRNLMLLEVLRVDALRFDYRYRVYGADVAASYGQDMTRRLASEFPDGIFKFFSALYEVAISRKIVIHSLHAPPMTVNVKKWERLIFPLGGPEVRWLLVVNLPKGKRRPE